MGKTGKDAKIDNHGSTSLSHSQNAGNNDKIHGDELIMKKHRENDFTEILSYFIHISFIFRNIEIIVLPF